MYTASEFVKQYSLRTRRSFHLGRTAPSDILARVSPWTILGTPPIFIAVTAKPTVTIPVSSAAPETRQHTGRKCRSPHREGQNCRDLPSSEQGLRRSSQRRTHRGIGPDWSDAVARWGPDNPRREGNWRDRREWRKPEGRRRRSQSWSGSSRRAIAAEGGSHEEDFVSIDFKWSRDLRSGCC